MDGASVVVVIDGVQGFGFRAEGWGRGGAVPQEARVTSGQGGVTAEGNLWCGVYFGERRGRGREGGGCEGIMTRGCVGWDR